MKSEKAAVSPEKRKARVNLLRKLGLCALVLIAGFGAVKYASNLNEEAVINHRRQLNGAGITVEASDARRWADERERASFNSEPLAALGWVIAGAGSTAAAASFLTYNRETAGLDDEQPIVPEATGGNE